tara:strand:- start:135 stop:644 length:510 start_codon:yes stop_codon:yes gene_type:complete
MSTAGVNLQQAAGTGTASGPQSGQANKAQPAQGQMPQQAGSPPQQAGSPPQQAPMNWGAYANPEALNQQAINKHGQENVQGFYDQVTNQQAINKHGQENVQDFYNQVLNQQAINQHGQENVQAYYDALQKQQGGLGQGVGPQAEVNNQQGSQQKLEEVMRQVMNTALGK